MDHELIHVAAGLGSLGQVMAERRAHVPHNLPPGYTWRTGVRGLEGPGLGVPGPYGRVPAQAVPASAYEISGTQVFLRDEPKLDSMDKGAFNAAYGANSNIVVGDPDQVDFDGQVGNADGYSWAHVTAKTGALAGQSGYVAMAYMAPIGWTKSQGKTSPAPVNPGGSGDDPKFHQTSDVTTTTTTTDYTPYILGGAALLGLGVIGWAVFSKPDGRGKKASGRRRRRIARHMTLAHA